jgi:hypothetical protein
MLSGFWKYTIVIGKAAMGEHSWWRSLMALVSPIAALLIWAVFSIIVRPNDATEAAVTLLKIWGGVFSFCDFRCRTVQSLASEPEGNRRKGC